MGSDCTKYCDKARDNMSKAKDDYKFMDDTPFSIPCGEARHRYGLDPSDCNNVCDSCRDTEGYHMKSCGDDSTVVCPPRILSKNMLAVVIIIPIVMLLTCVIFCVWMYFRKKIKTRSQDHPVGVAPSLYPGQAVVDQGEVTGEPQVPLEQHK